MLGRCALIWFLLCIRNLFWKVSLGTAAGVCDHCNLGILYFWCCLKLNENFFEQILFDVCSVWNWSKNKILIVKYCTSTSFYQKFLDYCRVTVLVLILEFLQYYSGRHISDDLNKKIDWLYAPINTALWIPFSVTTPALNFLISSFRFIGVAFPFIGKVGTLKENFSKLRD